MLGAKMWGSTLGLLGSVTPWVASALHSQHGAHLHYGGGAPQGLLGGCVHRGMCQPSSGIMALTLVFLGL